MASDGVRASRTRLPRTLRAFQSSNYRIYWLAGLLSHTSRWMQMTLLAWMVLRLTDSPLLVALVGFFAMVPMLFLGLLGGILADTVDRRRLIIYTNGAGFAAALAMLALLWSGAAEYWHAYAVILVNGSGHALEMPARRSVTLDLVGRTGITNALALDSVAMSASGVVASALAGGLIALADVAGGYVAVNLFYIVSVTLLWRLKVYQTKRSDRGETSMVRSLVQGLRYVMGHPILRAAVLITLIVNLLMFPYMTLVPVVARDVLFIGPALMGTLQSASGIGSLVGAVLVASAVNIRYHGRLFMGGAMLACVALLLFSLSRSYFSAVSTLLLVGLGTSMFVVMQPTLMVLFSKDEMRGTALGVVSLAIGSMPLGALLVGGVASARDPSFAIGLNAVIGIVGVAMIGLLIPSLRQPTEAHEGQQAAPR